MSSSTVADICFPLFADFASPVTSESQQLFLVFKAVLTVSGFVLAEHLIAMIS